MHGNGLVYDGLGNWEGTKGVNIPSGKLTWQWKNSHFQQEIHLQKVHCPASYVSLPECNHVNLRVLTPATFPRFPFPPRKKASIAGLMKRWWWLRIPEKRPYFLRMNYCTLMHCDLCKKNLFRFVDVYLNIALELINGKYIYIHHLESRWRNCHVLVYYGPLLSHLLGVVPSTITTVYIVCRLYNDYSRLAHWKAIIFHQWWNIEPMDLSSCWFIKVLVRITGLFPLNEWQYMGIWY